MDLRKGVLEGRVHLLYVSTLDLSDCISSDGFVPCLNRWKSPWASFREIWNFLFGLVNCTEQIWFTTARICCKWWQGVWAFQLHCKVGGKWMNTPLNFISTEHCKKDTDSISGNHFWWFKWLVVSLGITGLHRTLELLHLSRYYKHQGCSPFLKLS